MKVAGFTFVRNAVRFDYPVVESIRSILSLCDEVVVAVGKSEDQTRSLVESIGDPKIRILDTIWDDSLREGGRVLATETDKAFRAISPDADWAFYIQADEVLHEKYHEPVRASMNEYLTKKEVEGLLFDYLHFYGSYDFIGNSRKWYRHEVRIIRNNKEISSYQDAQGFRKKGKKLDVAISGGAIYHYGWVKPPAYQQAKQMNFHRYWHSDHWMEREIPKKPEFDYTGIDSLARFRGDHPKVMLDRIAAKNWSFDYDPSRKQHSLKNRLLENIEAMTGWRPGEYKNYRLLKQLQA